MESAQPPHWDASTTAATLERELRLIEDAVAYVASGAGERVTIGGLRFGEDLLERARQIAGSAGLRVTPLYSADEVGADLVIERRPGPDPAGSDPESLR